MISKRTSIYFIFILFSLIIQGCSLVKHEPIPLVKYVDLDKFMGAWYVIAHIPSYPEKNAFNAVETYKLKENGTIKTTFTFNEGSFTGRFRTLNPTGFIIDNQSNAIWGMQFIWPIKADYRITYLDDSYTQTIIAREKRDYVWIMARQPEISLIEYERLVNFVESLGYEKSKIRKVPHNN